MGSTVQLGQALRDGSYWTLNLHITESSTSCPWNSPPLPEGNFLTIDLRINPICSSLVVFQDEQYGNPSSFQELGTSVHFPGNSLTRAQYSSVLMLHWLDCLRFNGLGLDANAVRNFTNHVIDHVFATVNNLHDIRVTAELCRVSFELYAPDTPLPTTEQLNDNDEIIEEYDEEKKGLPEYCVGELSDYYAVFAAEKHRRFGDCSICLDHLFPVGEEEEEEGNNKYVFVFESPCGHFFHNECMTKWLRMSDSCPLCRFVMSSSLED